MWLAYDNGKRLLNTNFIIKIVFDKDAEEVGLTMVYVLSSSGERSSFSIPNDKVDAFKAKVCYDISNVDVEGL